ncbi:oxidoreductase [Diaporthe amygdali]|uniref:oxidoreductase n=1 Tax=Phomopsis amygdali TaxID=1214568 RepID=UPI0022FF383F|nr:oxidoreductase [Diaporthe amygdali]KAJ0108829.1 oxidoreductase [Diaporthe amygdali]
MTTVALLRIFETSAILDYSHNSSFPLRRIFFSPRLWRNHEPRSHPMINKVLDGVINGLRHAVRTIYQSERMSSCSFRQQTWGQDDLTVLSQSYAEHLVFADATAVDIAMSGDDALRKHYKPHRETTFACNAFETLNLLMLPRAST